MKKFYLICILALMGMQGFSQNNALNFDGVDDYVTIPTAFEGGDFTVEFWIKPTITSGYQCIMSMRDGSTRCPSLFVYGNKLHYDSYKSDNNIRFSGLLDNWFVSNEAVFVSWVKQGEKYYFYKNGILKDSATAPNTVKNTIMIDIGKLDAYYKGNMDELRFWNKARQEIEIYNNYDKELIGNEPGLVAYYKFNQGTVGGSNTAVTQLANNSNASKYGTLYNFSLTGTTSNWISSEFCTLPFSQKKALVLNVKSQNISGSSFIAEWICPYGATQWRIDLSTDPLFSSYTRTTLVSSTSHTFRNLRPKQKYYFRVIAFNEYEYSLFSDVKAVTTIGYCDAGAEFESEYISEILIGSGDIANYWGQNGYQDFRKYKADVYKDDSVKLYYWIANVKTEDELIVWIDFNNDDVFNDTNEKVIPSTRIKGKGFLEFNIPNTQANGEVPMRVRLHRNNVNNSPNFTPCGNSDYGEVEDYTLNIVEKLSNSSDVISNFKVGIYPNPVSDKLYVTSTDSYDVIKISNLTGQTVWQGNSNSLPIDVSQYQDGLYFISFAKDGEISTQKFIKK